MEKSDDTIYLCDKCLLGKFLIVISKYMELPPNIVRLSTLKEEEIHRLKELSPTGITTVLNFKDNVIAGVLPIHNYLARKSEKLANILIGNDPLKISANDTWLNFFLTSVAPIIAEINLQLYGEKPFNKGIFDGAVHDLEETLGKLNHHLKFRTFIIDHKVRSADLFAGVLLSSVYQEVMTEEFRKKVPNVVRLIKFILEIDSVKETVGEVKECKEMMKPRPFSEKKEEKKKDKKEKKDEKNHEKKDEKNHEKKDEKNHEKKHDKKHDKKEEKKDEKKEEKKN